MTNKNWLKKLKLKVTNGFTTYFSKSLIKSDFKYWTLNKAFFDKFSSIFIELPSSKGVFVLTQLLGRLSHPLPDLVDSIRTIICNVINELPHQVIWHLLDEFRYISCNSGCKFSFVFEYELKNFWQNQIFILIEFQTLNLVISALIINIYWFYFSVRRLYEESKKTKEKRPQEIYKNVLQKIEKDVIAKSSRLRSLFQTYRNFESELVKFISCKVGDSQRKNYVRLESECPTFFKMCNQTLKNLPEGKGVLIPLKKFLVPKFHRDEGARSGELIRSRYNVYNEPENLSSSQQVERTQLIRVSTISSVLR